MPDIDQLFSGSEDINQLIQLLYQLLQKQELHKAAGIQKLVIIICRAWYHEALKLPLLVW